MKLTNKYVIILSYYFSEKQFSFAKFKTARKYVFIKMSYIIY